MTKSVKFTFNTHFDEAAREVAAGPRARQNYSAEDIEKMRGEAREEGRRDGDVRASQAMAASLGQIAAAMHAAIDEIETIRAEAAMLALTAAKKLAAAALAAAPETEIVEALHVALHQAIGEPRVVVKTSPLLAAAIEAKTAEIAAKQGFEGRIQFVPDHQLSGADCRIEWRGGGIERSVSLIESALADLIARRFAGASANGGPGA